MHRPLRDLRPLSVRVAEVAEKLKSGEFTAMAAADALHHLSSAITAKDVDLGIVVDDLVEFLYADNPSIPTALIQLDGVVGALADEATDAPTPPNLEPTTLGESGEEDLFGADPDADLDATQNWDEVPPITLPDNTSPAEPTLVPTTTSASVEVDDQPAEPTLIPSPSPAPLDEEHDFTDAHGINVNKFMRDGDELANDKSYADFYDPQVKRRWPMLVALSSTLTFAVLIYVTFYLPISSMGLPEKEPKAVAVAEAEYCDLEPEPELPVCESEPVPELELPVCEIDLISPAVAATPEAAVAAADAPTAVASGVLPRPTPAFSSEASTTVGRAPGRVTPTATSGAIQKSAESTTESAVATVTACPPGTITCTQKAHLVGGTAFLILRDQSGRRGQWVVEGVTVASDGGCLYRGVPVPDSCLQVKEPGRYRAQGNCPQRELLYWFES
jgi:hypothetical protein